MFIVFFQESDYIQSEAEPFLRADGLAEGERHRPAQDNLPFPLLSADHCALL